MRLGVLDVGSNTVHFLVVDARQGGRPLPVFSHKAELHLGDHMEAGNRLSASVRRQLCAFVDEALQIAEDKGVEELLAFATSAVRDAANGDEVLSSVRDDTGVAIRVLPGEEEARLTFLAARRWFGWSSGRLLMLDIGGGSLEVAAGPADQGLAQRGPAVTGAGAAVAQACAGRDRAAGRGGVPARAARPCGSHVQDVPAAREDLWRRPVGRRAVRTALGQSR